MIFFQQQRKGIFMKTIIATIQKGGQGKTFLTCNLAFWLAAKKGLKICVIDLDTQGNSSFTLAKYASGFESEQLFLDENLNFDFSFLDEKEKPEELKIQIVKASPRLADFEKISGAELSKNIQIFTQNLQKLESFFDFCLIDTAPSLSNVLACSFLNGDFYYTPVELETYSLQGVEKILKVAQNLSKQNPKLKFLGILPNKVDVRKPRQKATLQTLKQTFGAYVMPYSLSLRDSFAQALSEQKPVWEIKKTAARKAIQEFNDVAQYVFENVQSA